METNYRSFLKSHTKPVAFGGALTFYSSLGQTFYISLFVPFILREFGLSKSEFGSYYAVATILASFLLFRFGKLMDYIPVKEFASKTMLLLLVSGIIFAASYWPWMIFIAIIGLRLGGQGLFPHIAFSVLARRFDSERGKAISIASLGFSIGEMIFPLMIGLVISAFHWRAGFIVGVILMLLTLWPMLIKMDLSDLDPQSAVSRLSKSKERSQDERKYLKTVIKESKFWMLMMPITFISFMTTGLFFYQYVLAEEKGWSMELYSFLFMGYAGARLLFTLYGGWLTDQFTARKIFPFYPLPMVIGVLVLAWVPGMLGAGIFLVMTGVTMGLNGVLRSSVVAEIYGIERIGHLQSVFTFMLVLSSAMAPPLYGYMLDLGLSFSSLNIITGFLLLIISLNACRLQKK
ncbi:MFS transporter [Membranihabitans marinus]|uniref:MFS transporter n=1 Tax=Membranihabitans marinus TaxID=1227546 RepID=UPI001F02C68F|nr:MFS transporter [Membranihabitans marinus]